MLAVRLPHFVLRGHAEGLLQRNLLFETSLRMNLARRNRRPTRWIAGAPVFYQAAQPNAQIMTLLTTSIGRSGRSTVLLASLKSDLFRLHLIDVRVINSGVIK